MSKNELEKFASTKHAGLPKHRPSEGAEMVANLFGRTLFEGGHKSGCTCGFCKNKGSFGKKKDADKKEPEEPTEPEKAMESEGAVKLSKGIGLDTKATKSFHNLTSKQQATPGLKVKKYIANAASLSGMDKSGQTQGFKNKSAGETTSGKKLGKHRPGESMTARMVVSALLD